MKREDEAIKQYLINLTISTLEKSRLFARTFGKGFAKEKLKLNLDKVYIDEFNSGIYGCYKQKDKSITIYSQEPNKDISIEDIENSESIKETVLHEALHAILERTSRECALYDIDRGTGAGEVYKDKSKLGTGLNEGLTTWILVKIGVKADGYLILLNTLNMLELAIGEEKVMRFGKGNIKGNIAKQLSMSYDECKDLLTLLDKELSRIRKLDEVNYIVDILRDYKNIDKLPLEDQETVKKEYLDLQDRSVYKKCKASTLELTIINAEKAQEYGEQLLDDIIGQLNKTVFDKYFKNDFDKLMHTDIERIPKKKLQRFNKLYELMKNVDFLGVEDFEVDYDIINEKVEMSRRNLALRRQGLFYTILSKFKNSSLADVGDTTNDDYQTKTLKQKLFREGIKGSFIITGNNENNNHKKQEPNERAC